MTNRLELYRCEICNNFIEVLVNGDGELVCCGQPMTLLIPKGAADEGLEKHVPVIENNGSYIRVGSIPHPMTDEHYIMFIEAISNDEVHLKFLHPNENAEMFTNISNENLIAREYCNIHGLWEAKSD